MVDDGNWDGNTRTTHRDCDSPTTTITYPSDVLALETVVNANDEKADSIDFPIRRTFTVDEQTPNERERAAIVLVARSGFYPGNKF